jgi:aryl-alcohol dehydrogenase-like predicted oxidoreductase
MRLSYDRTLKSTAIKKLGFGTWGLGGEAYGEISEEKAKNLITFAYRSGIRFFDTAPLYGTGRAERIVGEALKGLPRDTFQIATKAGLNKDGNTEVSDFNPNSIRKSVNSSLDRLQVSYIDHLLLHSPEVSSLDLSILDSFGVEEHIKSRKILNFGVSLAHPNDLGFFSTKENFETLEFNYSLMDQRMRSMWAKDSKIQNSFTIARTPFNYGFLTDTPPVRNDLLDSYHHLNRWPQSQFDKWSEFREIWLKISQSNGLRLEELALSFILSSDFIDKVIPGFMNDEQIKIALTTAGRGQLTTESVRFLNDIYDKHAESFKVIKKT